jgi:superoxide dismutase, Fe-Mn family
MNAQTSGPFQLPPLPWDENALDPVVSARTIGFHYGAHHLAYVKKLNELVAGTPFAAMPLEKIITETAGNAERRKIFNNAAQAWNHTFFWSCMRPRAGGEPSGALAQRIEAGFGGFKPFRDKFVQAAVDCFGSGWAWLADRNGKLEVMATSNADNPMTHGATPLFTVDVWEHAYYLDYQNKRQAFVEAVFDKLANWDFVQRQLDAAASRKAA